MKNASSVSAFIVALSAIAAGAFASAACSSDDDTTNPGGSSTSSSSGSSGTTSGDAGTSGTTSSSSSTGGTSSGNAAADAAKASCTKQQKCEPNTFGAEYSSIDDCTTQTTYTGPTVAALPGIDPACATNSATAACGVTPPECLKGTQANGASCLSAGQCTSGVCSGVTATACGTCAAAKASGDACSATDFNCGPGLRCDFTTSKCAATLADGDDCSGANAAACGTGLVCLSDTTKCGAPRDIDGVCKALTGTFSTDCRSGLQCASSKCADVAPTTHAIGETCATGDFCKGGATCVGVQGGQGGTCTAYAKSGDDCAIDGSKAACNPNAGLTCSSNKCVAATAVTCN